MNPAAMLREVRDGIVWELLWSMVSNADYAGGCGAGAGRDGQDVPALGGPVRGGGPSALRDRRVGCSGRRAPPEEVEAVEALYGAGHREPKEPESAFPPGAVAEGEASRHPLPEGGADGRQRQLRGLQGRDAADPAATPPVPLRAGQGDGPRVRGRRHGPSSTGPGGWGATMRRGACRSGPERRHEPFRRPPRLAPLASSGGGTPERTIIPDPAIPM